MLNKGLLLGKKIKLYNIIRGSVSNVSLSYSPQTDIKAGTTVNITVNANSGYQNPWVTVSKNDETGNVTVSGSGSNRSFIMPKSDVTITAGASVIPTYSVSGSASGGDISFSKTSGIRAGETVTVYLSPNSYYTLSSLTSSPSVSFSGSGNKRTFKMPSSNVSVTATFVSGYTLMVTVGVMRSNITIYGCYEGGYGSISPSTLTIGGKQVAFSELYCGASNNWKRLDIHMIMDGKDYPPYLGVDPIKRLWVGRMDKRLKAQLEGKYQYAKFSQDFFTEADVGKTIGVWVSNNPPPW